ncbi:MAG TPA: hypothetical protein VFI65_17875 [Streptosporangiaceae bacterium]|nr:hypothetical protein [Streptosporangiaceae bacterium]
MTQPPSTITVTTRRRAWLRRLTVTHPEHPPLPPPPGNPRYDADRARELFTRTATCHQARPQNRPYRIPPRPPLTPQHHPPPVSYITVRHATAILRERRLIVSIHGRGTYVEAALNPNPPVGRAELALPRCHPSQHPRRRCCGLAAGLLTHPVR